MLKTSLTGVASLAGPLSGPSAPLVLDSSAILRLIDSLEGEGKLLPAASTYNMEPDRVAIADAAKQFMYGASIGTAKQSSYILSTERTDFSDWSVPGESSRLGGGLLPLKWNPAPRQLSDNLYPEVRTTSWNAAYSHVPNSAYYDAEGRIHVEPNGPRSIYTLNVYFYNLGLTEGESEELRAFNLNRSAHIAALRQEVADGSSRRYYVDCAPTPFFITRPSDSSIPPDPPFAFQLRTDMRVSFESSANLIRIVGLNLANFLDHTVTLSTDFNDPYLTSQVMALVAHFRAESSFQGFEGYEWINIAGSALRPMYQYDPAPLALLDSDLWEDGGVVSCLGYDGTVASLSSVIYDLTAHPIVHDRPFSIALCALPYQYWVQDQGEAYFKKEV
jgi:hypothetical protein